MQSYSAFSLFKQALGRDGGWERQWRSPQPKTEYDVIIVGVGGHGLATAYYLAKEHGITKVAVLEKAWLGGGNTGRNTTIIRSNYLFDESAALYEHVACLCSDTIPRVTVRPLWPARGLTGAERRAGHGLAARWLAVRAADSRAGSGA